MGEILPGKIRGSAASVATAFNWLCTFIVTKTFPDILSNYLENFKKKSARGFINSLHVENRH